MLDFAGMSILNTEYHIVYDCLHHTAAKYMFLCSPLFCILQALLDASNVDGDLDVVKDAVLYLLCVFRAIKRAEDAVDVEKTPVRVFSWSICPI